jgi:hypothetical protein
MTIILRFCLAIILASAFCSSSLAESKSYAGTYVADLPSASGCGRRVLLELFEDESYLFVQRYLCKPWSNAQLRTGVWKADADRVVLSSTGDEMQFSMGEGGLDYVGTRYGQAGLYLEQLK